MLVDRFGYEDLIYELARHSIKVFLDPQSLEVFKLQQHIIALHEFFCSDENEAEIVLVNKLAEDTEKYLQIENLRANQNWKTCFFSGRKYYEDNIVSVKLTMDRDAVETEHLRTVNYTLYPTQGDIFHIASLVAPLSIGVINDVDGPPFELCELCRYKSTDKNSSL